MDLSLPKQLRLPKMEAIRGRVGILARAAAIMVPTVMGVTRVAMEKMQQETLQIRRKNVVAEIRNCVASGRTARKSRSTVIGLRSLIQTGSGKRSPTEHW